MEAHSVLVVDGVDLSLIGAETLINGYETYRLDGLVHSYDDLVEFLETVMPSVIVLGDDIEVALDVIILVRRIRDQAPTARLVMVGGIMVGALIHDLIQAGLDAYLFNGDEMRICLLQALDAVTQGRRYLSPTANAEYLITMQSPEANARLDDEARQVLHLLATGAHIGQISLRLNIDNRRVYWIREKLRRYFGANTNEHLISCAYAEGILRNAL